MPGARGSTCTRTAWWRACASTRLRKGAPWLKPVRTQRRRALKLMLPSLAADADLRARFELEARVTAHVESEHIVETFDAGVDPETKAPFLVTELLKGEDLGTRLDRGTPLAPSEVVLLLEQAARALDRTHEAGIVHRDLKPNNLFVTRRDDGSPRLKILDFGIAKFVAQSTDSMKTTRSVGTPVYMSPEQIRGDGDIDQRADVYSLAHIAYALLVGSAYWETEARSTASVYPLLMKIVEGAKDPATRRAAARGVSLPAPFDAWFARATASEPCDRFATAGNLVRELADVFGVGGEVQVASSVPRSWSVNALVAAGVALGAVAIAITVLSARPAPTPHPANASPVSSVGPTVATGPSASGSTTAATRAAPEAAAPAESSAQPIAPTSQPPRGTSHVAGRVPAAPPTAGPVPRHSSAAPSAPPAAGISEDPSDTR